MITQLIRVHIDSVYFHNLEWDWLTTTALKSHVCVILMVAVVWSGHRLRAAVRLLVRRPLWCVVPGHHRHRAGRWRPPSSWDASSQSPLQDPAVSPLGGAGATQLEAANGDDQAAPFSEAAQWQTQFCTIYHGSNKMSLHLKQSLTGCLQFLFLLMAAVISACWRRRACVWWTSMRAYSGCTPLTFP